MLTKEKFGIKNDIGIISAYKRVGWNPKDATVKKMITLFEYGSEQPLPGGLDKVSFYHTVFNKEPIISYGSEEIFVVDKRGYIHIFK